VVILAFLLRLPTTLYGRMVCRTSPEGTNSADACGFTELQDRLMNAA
jgi:hypothetical protein